jgi:hypothetical protein
MQLLLTQPIIQQSGGRVWYYLRRNTFMMFNLASYTRMLMADFQANGGKIEIDE